MKKQLFLATILVALLGVGIYVFTKFSSQTCPPLPVSKNKLIGSWKIDTAYNNKDSANINTIIPMIFKDSSELVFKEDSIVDFVTSKSTETTNYYLINDSLFYKEDSVYKPNFITFLNDTTFKIVDKAETTVLYKKVK